MPALLWVLLGVLLALVLLAALALLFVAPSRPSAALLAPFARRCFAHRGLHTPDKSVPENSLSAFRRAVEAGYGIELDIQLSRDAEVVVFHDDTLDRVCGVQGRVDAFDLAALRQMRLCGTGEGIPLFSEVLAAVDGRAPLIVELKSGPRNRLLCEKALALLRGYQGDFCIESFDPRIVRWFRKNAPDLLRGQLSGPPHTFDTLPAVGGFVLGNLLSDLICRPQFVAYDNKPKPFLVRLACRMGAARVVWTAREEADHQRLCGENDAIIFEFYRPDPRF